MFYLYEMFEFKKDFLLLLDEDYFSLYKLYFSSLLLEIQNPNNNILFDPSL